MRGSGRAYALRGRVMSDELRVEIARLQERLGALEKKYEGLMTKLWATMSIGVGWVLLRLLEMIGKS